LIFLNSIKAKTTVSKFENVVFVMKEGVIYKD